MSMVGRTFTADSTFAGGDCACWRDDGDGRPYRIFCGHDACRTYTAVSRLRGSPFGRPEALIADLQRQTRERIQERNARFREAATLEDKWRNYGGREALMEVLDDLSRALRAGREE